MSQYLSHLAGLTLNQVQPLQPRLASRFETPAIKKVSDNDGIAMIEESPFSSFAHSQPSVATNRPSPVTQKVMTEFNDGQIKKEPKQQNPFKFIEHTEPEPVIKQPDMPKHEQKSSIDQSFSPIETESVRKVAPSIIQPDLQPSYAISGIEHTEPVIKQSDMPKHEQKSSIGQSFSPIETEPVRKVTSSIIQPDLQPSYAVSGIEHTEPVIKQSDVLKHEQKSTVGQSFSPIETEPVPAIIQPVLQPSYAVSSKDSLPKENTHTIIERVRENFTEITHNEFVIREIAEQPHSHQKIGIFEESIKSEPFTDRVMTEQIPFQSSHKNYSLEEQPRSIPVKPNNIVVRTEQSIVPSNTPGQFGVQQTPAAQFGIDTTPAPTIQVTIGRIEIRATQVSDKSSAKPRAASATLSLDDYLKQRNGGRS